MRERETDAQRKRETKHSSRHRAQGKEEQRKRRREREREAPQGETIVAFADGSPFLQPMLHAGVLGLIQLVLIRPREFICFESIHPPRI